MNLCLNAKDAFGDNKGLITLSSEMVELNHSLCNSCFQNISGSYVAIQVKDNGCGIDDDVINRLLLTPDVEELQLKRFKKRKLKLKDTISQLENILIPDILA